jgi:hypothetical protein
MEFSFIYVLLQDHNTPRVHVYEVTTNHGTGSYSSLIHSNKPTNVCFFLSNGTAGPTELLTLELRYSDTPSLASKKVCEHKFLITCHFD